VFLFQIQPSFPSAQPWNKRLFLKASN
jgi:hypothetical protein